MRIVPTFDYVLIQPDEPAEKSEGGIYIPRGMQTQEDEYGKVTRWEIGTILAVGPGRITDDNHEIPSRLTQGRKVVFKAYSGQDFEEGPFKGQVLIPPAQVGGYVE